MGVSNKNIANIKLKCSSSRLKYWLTYVPWFAYPHMPVPHHISLHPSVTLTKIFQHFLQTPSQTNEHNNYHCHSNLYSIKLNNWTFLWIIYSISLIVEPHYFLNKMALFISHSLSNKQRNWRESYNLYYMKSQDKIFLARRIY